MVIIFNMKLFIAFMEQLHEKPIMMDFLMIFLNQSNINMKIQTTKWKEVGSVLNL